MQKVQRGLMKVMIMLLENSTNANGTLNILSGRCHQGDMVPLIVPGEQHPLHKPNKMKIEGTFALQNPLDDVMTNNKNTNNYDYELAITYLECPPPNDDEKLALSNETVEDADELESEIGEEQGEDGESGDSISDDLPIEGHDEDDEEEEEDNQQEGNSEVENRNNSNVGNSNVGTSEVRNKNVVLMFLICLGVGIVLLAVALQIFLSSQNGIP